MSYHNTNELQNNSNMNKLTQKIFENQPLAVNWCGVDYDGELNYGVAINPRYTWASERWRGFKQIGDTVENSGFEPLTSLKRI